MLIIISPAKTLDYSPQDIIQEYSVPIYLKEASRLVGELQKLSPEDLSDLMKINKALAHLNYERFHTWRSEHTPANSKQAILAYRGMVYLGMRAESFNNEDFGFAQQHLCILSGLYGVLRPLDFINPHRLEMGTAFKTRYFQNLYQFWQKKITSGVNKQLKEIKSKILINLASAEYFRSIQPGMLNTRIITPEFREERDGKYVMVTIYAKKARGMMSRFIIKNKLDDPENLKLFEEEGYRYNDHLSQKDVWVFTR